MMDGKRLPHPSAKDLSDPFGAGQMIGMITILTFIEKNGGINADMLQDLKWTCANNASVFLDKPAEDIFLSIDSLVKEIK